MKIHQNLHEVHEVGRYYKGDENATPSSPSSKF